MRLRPELRFAWDEDSGRYRDLRTGRYLSRGRARALLDSYTDQISDRMARVSESLVRGEISLTDWESRMRGLVKEAHAVACATARGGWSRMTQADYGRLGSIVKEQYRYLRSFSADVALGIVPRTNAIRARARLYAESGRRTHFETERRLMAGRGYVEERSVLGIADHCDGCLEEAGKRWRPIGTLLPIGGRDCKARCRCHFEYRKAGEQGPSPDRIPVLESATVPPAKLKYLRTRHSRSDKSKLLEPLGFETDDALHAAIRSANVGKVAKIDERDPMKPDGSVCYTLDADLVGPRETRRLTFVWKQTDDGVFFVTLRPPRK